MPSAVIDECGCVCFLHTEDNIDVFYNLNTEKDTSISRASRIELLEDLPVDIQQRIELTVEDYDPLSFWAVISLTIVPTILGPFRTHKAACAAETKWLMEHNHA